MPQITTITSEALQATIRRLLPSQRGFGMDLEAQNVIVPVIDLTPTAEYPQLPSYLQQAQDFGNIAIDTANGATETFISGSGFYRVIGTSSIAVSNTATKVNYFQINDSSSTKRVFTHTVVPGINNEVVTNNFDFITYLRPGHSLEVVAGAAEARVDASGRQIADVYGNLTNPLGFTFE